MQRTIAKIRDVTLEREDHGIMTCWLHLDYGGAEQGAGGYALDDWDEKLGRRVGTAYGMEFIIRLMEACGVREWSKIKGRTVFAVSGDEYHGKVLGIEPLPTEQGTPFMFDELRSMVEA